MNLHIRITLESESIPDSRYDHVRDKDRATWSLGIRDNVTGDWKETAFLTWFPRRDNLSAEDVREAIRLCASRPNTKVSGDRAAVTAFGVSSR